MRRVPLWRRLGGLMGEGHSRHEPNGSGIRIVTANNIRQTQSDPMKSLGNQSAFSWQHIVFAAGCVILAAGIGSLTTIPNIPTWYAGLEKPGFTPPNWAFGPAWTVLYILMGISFWRILERGNRVPGKTVAVVLFLVQLALNAFWSVAFFGLHSPLFGLAVISAMIVFIIATIFAFWRLDRLAGLLMIPYLAWVSFACALNLSVFLLNR